MDQLGRARGGPAGQVVHLGKKDGKAASDGIARNAAAIDAATYDENVTDRRCVHKFLHDFALQHFWLFTKPWRNYFEMRTNVKRNITST